MTSGSDSAFVTVQPGPRNAYIDSATGLRFYRWRGTDYPSVTSIRRAAGLSHGLHQWAINKVVEHAIGQADSIASRLAQSNFDEGIVRVIRHELRGAATAERDAAAALGTAVHDAAASGMRVEDVELALKPRLAHYLDWLDVSGARILGTEFQVFNLDVGYAGTGDLLVQLPNGRVWLVDIKTGKGIWSEHALQVTAYARAQFVGQDDVIDETLTGWLAMVTGIAILHLTNTGWEFHALKIDVETWRAFRGLLLFARWMLDHGDPSTTIAVSRTGQSLRYCVHGVDVTSGVACAVCAPARAS